METPWKSAQLIRICVDCWLGVRTWLSAGERESGRNGLLAHNRTPLPMGDPWRPSHTLRMFIVEHLQQAGVGEV